METEGTPGEAVKIVIQSSDPDMPNRAFAGIIEDFRQKQLLLLADEEVQEQAQITAQTHHLMYFGSVLNSLARSDGKWEIAVAVHRRLGMV